VWTAKTVFARKVHERPRVALFSDWVDVDDDESSKPYGGRRRGRRSSSRDEREIGALRLLQEERRIRRTRSIEGETSPIRVHIAERDTEKRSVLEPGRSSPPASVTIPSPIIPKISSKRSKRRFNFRLRPNQATQQGVFEGEDMERLKTYEFYKRLQALYEETVIYEDDGFITVNLASLHHIDLLLMQEQLVVEALDF
jgi:hypothetical protein